MKVLSNYLERLARFKTRYFDCNTACSPLPLPQDCQFPSLSFSHCEIVFSRLSNTALSFSLFISRRALTIAFLDLFRQVRPRQVLSL